MATKTTAKAEEEVPLPAQGERLSLAKIGNLLALHLIQEKPQTTQILLLHKAGFTYQEIATLVGTTKETARVTVHKQTKGKAMKAKPKVKQETDN